MLLLPFLVNSQKEDHNWIFNWSSVDSNAIDSEFMASVLNFNDLPPRHFRQSEITLDFDKTNAIASDSLGKILMYSNGQTIYGNDHNPILNGDTINYSPKWDWLSWANEFGDVNPSGFRISQLIGIIPWPDKQNHWMILYQNYEDFEEDGDFYELWQATVAINDDEVLEVIEKDKIIDQAITRAGMVTACKHGNGKDWWLIQANYDTLNYYIITVDGIHLDHSQKIENIITFTNGQTKFSQDGSAFSYFGTRWDDQVEDSLSADIFYADFNRCDGYLNNIQFKSYESRLSVLNNGLEFSPNGDFLYLAETEKILQFDTREDNFLDKPTVIREWGGIVCNHWTEIDEKFGLMQMGPDGKIYISGANQCFNIHTIDNPNEKGLDCNFNYRAIQLETFHVGTIPNFNTLRLGPLDGSPCDTLDLDNNPISRFWYEQDSMDYQEIQFRDISYYRPEEWSWDFDDGFTSNEMNPIHTYNSNGVYEVCLTVSNENSSNTSCQELQIGPVANEDFVREYDISIFPNPVEDVTRLVFHDYLPERSSIILYDAKGLKVFKSRIYQETMIDLSDLKSGVYFYEVIDEAIFLTSGKIVKL